MMYVRQKGHNYKRRDITAIDAPPPKFQSHPLLQLAELTAKGVIRVVGRRR